MVRCTDRPCINICTHSFYHVHIDTLTGVWYNRSELTSSDQNILWNQCRVIIKTCQTDNILVPHAGVISMSDFKLAKNEADQPDDRTAGRFDWSGAKRKKHVGKKNSRITVNFLLTNQKRPYIPWFSLQWLSVSLVWSSVWLLVWLLV